MSRQTYMVAKDIWLIEILVVILHNSVIRHISLQVATENLSYPCSCCHIPENSKQGKGMIKYVEDFSSQRYGMSDDKLKLCHGI